MVVEVHGFVSASAYKDDRGNALASLNLTATTVQFHSSSKDGESGAGTHDEYDNFAPRDVEDIPF